MSDATSARLRVLTFEPNPPDNQITLDATQPCSGGYTCLCAGCHLERQRRLRTGVRPSRQPWHSRKAA